jgi:hypothetical protein
VGHALLHRLWNMGTEKATRDHRTSRFLASVGKCGSCDYAPDIHAPTIIINQESYYYGL